MAKIISKIDSLSLPLWKNIVGLLILNLVIFSIIFISVPIELKVQYIPDDAFYYLTLARNFATSNLWTFDSGISLTSGFHLLFAYLLTSIFELFQPDSAEFILGGLILSGFFSAIFVLIATYLGFKQKNPFFLMIFALIISSTNFIVNTVSITEWSLTLLFALLYCVYFFYCVKGGFHLSSHLILFTLGFLGSLARADYGLLPFSITCATTLLYVFKVFPKNQLFLSIAGLLGAFWGLVAGFGHNYLFTMEFLQSSARMKAHWAELTEPNYFVVFIFILQILGLFGSAAMAFISIRLSALLLYKFRTRANRSLNIFLSDCYQLVIIHFEPSKLLMIWSSIICLIGYSIFYSRNPAIQNWYTSNLIVPIMMLFYGSSDFILSKIKKKSRIFFMALFLSALVIRGFRLYPLNANHSPWPHQKVMLNAGMYLKEYGASLPNGRVGAWNAGIIGYYQGGHVVNLDGLVNNDIYRFAVKNELPTYLVAKNIICLIDFEIMFSDEHRRMRGGYNDTEFIDKLLPIKVFSSEDEGSFWKHLTLYQITEFPNPPD